MPSTTYHLPSTVYRLPSTIYQLPRHELGELRARVVASVDREHGLAVCPRKSDIGPRLLVQGGLDDAIALDHHPVFAAQRPLQHRERLRELTLADPQPQ